MSIKALINREINARKERIRGVCVSNPAQKNMDPSGVRFFSWVVDVDIGGDRLLRDVPVKINGPKARFYARAGSPVYLDKDAQGRYQVSSPADRQPTGGGLLIIDEELETTATGTIGFTVTREPFEFYKGVTPESFYDPDADPNNLLWLRTYDRLLGEQSNIVAFPDTDGALVTALIDKSGNGHSMVEVSGSATPLFRKFDTTGGNTNGLSSADGFGSYLRSDTQVSETVGGVISIFILLNKDAVGSAFDTILQLQDWRIYSRTSSFDEWAIVHDASGSTTSGGTIGSQFVLIEIVSTAWNAATLYQDGVLLGAVAPPGTGGAYPSSSVFRSQLGSQAHDGRLLEVLVLDEAVGEAKRLTIEAYFNQAMKVAYSRWGSSIHGFPKILITDPNGNEV